MGVDGVSRHGVKQHLDSHLPPDWPGGRCKERRCAARPEAGPIHSSRINLRRVSSRSPSAEGCGGLRGPDILTGLPGRLKQPLGVFPALGAASNSGGGRISITGFGLQLTGLKQNQPSFGTLRLRFARRCLRDQRAPAAGKDAYSGALMLRRRLLLSSLPRPTPSPRFRPLFVSYTTLHMCSILRTPNST